MTLHSILRAHEQQHHCEALYTEGRIHDAAESLIEIKNTGSNQARPHMRIVDWVTGKFWYLVVEQCSFNLSRQNLRTGAYRHWNKSETRNRTPSNMTKHSVPTLLRCPSALRTRTLY